MVLIREGYLNVSPNVISVIMCTQEGLKWSLFVKAISVLVHGQFSVSMCTREDLK